MGATLLQQKTGTVGRPSSLTMLCALLVCALTAQYAAASTTNSTITSSPPEERHNGTGDTGDADRHRGEHKIHVLAIEFESVKEPLIFTIVVLLAGLSKIGKFLLLLVFSLKTRQQFVLIS